MPPRWRMRIIEAVSAPYEIDGHQVVIGTSVGIAVGPTDGMTPDQLMRNADLALYRAKGDGRGTYRFFEPEMDAQMQARRALEYDLRKALRPASSSCTTSPSSISTSNEISGFEALMRWRHPEKGMVPPGAFIPLAEEIGLIVPLGEWVIRQACAHGRASGRSDLKVAVNLSPVQFRSPGLVQVVVERAGGVGPARRPARARDHREHAAAGQRGDARHALPAARARRAHRHGRFRHRLFLAQLPAELPVRQDQDRPLVREGHRRRRRLAQHRARRGGAWPTASA